MIQTACLMTAHNFLRDLVSSSIVEGHVRLHIKENGEVLKEAPGLWDAAIYPEKHKTTDMSQKMTMFGISFTDYVEVIARGAGYDNADQVSGYFTWESTLGALGDKSRLAGRSVNWFYRPASRGKPAVLIAGIPAAVATLDMPAPAQAA
jgi:hypothetical protein